MFIGRTAAGPQVAQRPLGAGWGLTVRLHPSERLPRVSDADRGNVGRASTARWRVFISYVHTYHFGIAAVALDRWTLGGVLLVCVAGLLVGAFCESVRGLLVGWRAGVCCAVLLSQLITNSPACGPFPA